MAKDFTDAVLSSFMTTLQGNASFMGKITGLYDIVPDNVKSPYIIIGVDLLSYLPTSTTEYYQYTVTFTIWCSSRSMKETNGIVQEITTAMNDINPVITGATVEAIRFQERETDLRKPPFEWKTDVIYRLVLGVSV